MNDFLTRVITQATGVEKGALPLTPSIFAPASPLAEHQSTPSLLCPDPGPPPTPVAEALRGSDPPQKDPPSPPSQSRCETQSVVHPPREHSPAPVIQPEEPGKDESMDERPPESFSEKTGVKQSSIVKTEIQSEKPRDPNLPLAPESTDNLSPSAPVEKERLTPSPQTKKVGHQKEERRPLQKDSGSAQTGSQSSANARLAPNKIKGPQTNDPTQTKENLINTLPVDLSEPNPIGKRDELTHGSKSTTTESRAPVDALKTVDLAAEQESNPHPEPAAHPPPSKRSGSTKLKTNPKETLQSKGNNAQRPAEGAAAEAEKKKPVKSRLNHSEIARSPSLRKDPSQRHVQRLAPEADGSEKNPSLPRRMEVLPTDQRIKPDQTARASRRANRSEPAVSIHIGTIEVKQGALQETQRQSVPERKARESFAPAVSLESYLERKRG